MDKLTQANRELKAHYYESHGDEVVERWEECENTREAKKEFERNLAVLNVELNDPIFQQLYGFYAGDCQEDMEGVEYVQDQGPCEMYGYRI